MDGVGGAVTLHLMIHFSFVELSVLEFRFVPRCKSQKYKQ